ncbi:MAG TPA: GntR family transcriptional regulator [Actinomycetes bacterium]|jgi:GntR family transcriptional regulator|nr:GntR family transcriptional regulator [Actinomycetes bacterium]
MIEFYLDRTSGVATYLQLVHQVKQALRLGLLRPGEQLPTAKEVVAQLGINPNTVLKAYRDLEREGLVAPRPGQGTFVQQSLVSPSLVGTDRLQRALAGWVHDARGAGLAREDMAALFDRAVRESEEGIA